MYEIYCRESLGEICLGFARKKIKYPRDYFSWRLKLSRTVSKGGVSESSIVIGFGLVNVRQPGWLIIIKKKILTIKNCAIKDLHRV